MKITIDTQAKTISVDESVNIEELLSTIKGFLPNDLWKEYKITPVEYSYPVSYPFTFAPWPSIPYVTNQPYYGGVDPYCNGSATTVVTATAENGTVFIIDN